MASISRMASAYSSLYLHDTRGRHSRRSLHTPCTFGIRRHVPSRRPRLCEQQGKQARRVCESVHLAMEASSAAICVTM